MSELLRLQENPFPHPKQCQICAPQNQQFFWRATTQNHFNHYQANPPLQPIDFKQFAGDVAQYEEDNLLVDVSVLDNKPRLWTSSDPRISLAVGIARGVFYNQDVVLTGFNYCEHDIEAGVEAFDIFPGGYDEWRELYYMKKTDSHKATTDYMFHSGTVFSHLRQEQIEGGTQYKVMPSFMQLLRDEYQTNFPKADKNDESYMMNIHSSVRNTILKMYHPNVWEKDWYAERNLLDPRYVAFLKFFPPMEEDTDTNDAKLNDEACTIIANIIERTRKDS
ncbi:hypothetical protein BH09PAT2_BH09PAT2_10570 [soil metagenome]